MSICSSLVWLMYGTMEQLFYLRRHCCANFVFSSIWQQNDFSLLTKNLLNLHYCLFQPSCVNHLFSHSSYFYVIWRLSTDIRHIELVTYELEQILLKIISIVVTRDISVGCFIVIRVNYCLALQGVQRSGKSQGNSRLGKSQGKVREFCWRSGKKWILGKVREFAFSAI